MELGHLQEDPAASRLQQHLHLTAVELPHLHLHLLTTPHHSKRTRSRCAGAVLVLKVGLVNNNVLLLTMLIFLVLIKTVYTYALESLFIIMLTD